VPRGAAGTSSSEEFHFEAIVLEILADFDFKAPHVAKQGGPNGHLCDKSKLLFPAINVNVNIIESSPGRVFGRRFLPDGTWRAIDVMIGGKRAVVTNYVDMCKGCSTRPAHFRPA
jgi:hypothetical protein